MPNPSPPFPTLDCLIFSCRSFYIFIFPSVVRSLKISRLRDFYNIVRLSQRLVFQSSGSNHDTAPAGHRHRRENPNDTTLVSVEASARLRFSAVIVCQRRVLGKVVSKTLWVQVIGHARRVAPSRAGRPLGKVLITCGVRPLAISVRKLAWSLMHVEGSALAAP